MRRIESRENPLFKEWRRIGHQAHSRRETGMAILEGAHLCSAYLDAGRVPSACLVDPGQAEALEIAHRVMGTDSNRGSRSVYALAPDLLKAIGTAQSGVAVLFVVACPSSETVPGLEGWSVLIDRVQDPGNVGAIMRTAAAAGVERMYLEHQSAQVWSPKVLRAGMGAHFAIDVHENCALRDLVLAAKIPVYAADGGADRSLYGLDLRGPHAWIFGHEGQGIDSELLALATPVRIPQSTRIESLNVAAAAAVCLFEARRQRIGGE